MRALDSFALRFTSVAEAIADGLGFADVALRRAKRGAPGALLDLDQVVAADRHPGQAGSPEVVEPEPLAPVETAIATRGALLFRFSADPFTGARPKLAHVALSLGDGHTIEARDTARGVGVFPALDRGWSHAGRLPGIDYSAVPPGGAITLGAEGPEVKAWQRDVLRWRPGILPKYGADSKFGKETLAATKLFQQEMALPITGVVGPETREAMQHALPRPLCTLEVLRALSRALLGVDEARRAAERAASRSPSGGAPREAGGAGLEVLPWAWSSAA